MSESRPVRAAANAALVLALVLVPLFFEPFRVTQFTQILVVAIAVAGLNLLTGFTGQVSVGHSAFFGIGAYVTGVLIVHAGVPMTAAIIAGTLSGGIAGALFGIPSLRIKGTHLAIVTLVLAASLPAVLSTFSEITGGTEGLRVPRITPPRGSFLAADQTRYYVVLGALLLVVLGVFMLDRSRTGRALRALGDNEIAAVTYGVRPMRLRIGVFAASSTITALAGALFAVTSGFISSTTSYMTIVGSIVFLTALVIGGRALLAGPLAGAAIAELLPAQISRYSPEWANFAYGAILIALLLLAPGGISSLRFRRRRSHPAPHVLPAPLQQEETPHDTDDTRDQAQPTTRIG
ncbi:branched-chain amino acid ABC transporter permease [Acrocarpospora macrocephala]|uniref:branched-chain amino acid ABC transporter permease n=1 Tax=Acrocarpospora macrocephala TaxID=150177 RepID=UPI0012D323E2|nr:branched-chain amino acid ABC transporter permease [Acrocarpospora macrocephala]